jgi:Delta carbonic anhydrase
MMRKLALSLSATGALLVLASTESVWADDPASCTRAGPQSPRDITKRGGTNPVTFAKAPSFARMRICDVHFHKFAEHKAPGYSKQAREGDLKGYVCNGKTPPKENSHGSSPGGCAGIAIGDTIEIHWVFTTCNVEPAPTLASCFSPNCSNPELRVEARVFYLTDNRAAGDSAHFIYKSGNIITLPRSRGAVEYLGSTTGEKYNNGTCSPYAVTWNVSPTCSPLKFKTINEFCGDNIFKEDRAHGVRQLVSKPELLSAIK